jgi:hypothetical protein
MVTVGTTALTDVDLPQREVVLLIVVGVAAGWWLVG